MFCVLTQLFLGNIKFQTQQVEGVEGCSVKASASLNKVCELLQIDSKALQNVLTFRELQTMAPGGRIDTYQIPQHSAQASARRDSLSKVLPLCLFTSFL